MYYFYVPLDIFLNYPINIDYVGMYKTEYTYSPKRNMTKTSTETVIFYKSNVIGYYSSQTN